MKTEEVTKEVLHAVLGQKGRELQDNQSLHEPNHVRDSSRESVTLQRPANSDDDQHYYQRHALPT